MRHPTPGTRFTRQRGTEDAVWCLCAPGARCVRCSPVAAKKAPWRPRAAQVLAMGGIVSSALLAASGVPGLEGLAAVAGCVMLVANVTALITKD